MTTYAHSSLWIVDNFLPRVDQKLDYSAFWKDPQMFTDVTTILWNCLSRSVPRSVRQRFLPRKVRSIYATDKVFGTAVAWHAGLRLYFKETVGSLEARDTIFVVGTELNNEVIEIVREIQESDAVLCGVGVIGDVRPNTCLEALEGEHYCPLIVYEDSIDPVPVENRLQVHQVGLVSLYS